MEADFWLDRWQQSQIGFHQSKPEALLKRHWPKLSAPPGSAVFVPLCGKSLDMVWLADQGHRIVGSELSEIAIDDFFANLGLTAQIRTEAGFKIKSAGPYELWCGDIFTLPLEATAHAAAAYDRAALIALPPDMRQRYASKLIELNQRSTKTLLITLEYDQSILPGPPHNVSQSEVDALFSKDYQIAEIERGETSTLSPKFKEHGLDTVIQTTYIMTPQDDPA